MRLVHFFLGERQLHAQNLGAVEQAVCVVFQAEDRGALLRLVRSHAFKGAATIVQRVRQHVDLGIAPVQHLAVHPDLAVTVGHRGYYGAHGNPFFNCCQSQNL
uniref:Uncharacterized protein n=1 Tax=bioreactor metagenome TaxID=1076179 RepID=A0A645BLW0_9ZZZZ